MLIIIVFAVVFLLFSSAVAFAFCLLALIFGIEQKGEVK